MPISLEKDLLSGDYFVVKEQDGKFEEQPLKGTYATLTRTTVPFWSGESIAGQTLDNLLKLFGILRGDLRPKRARCEQRERRPHGGDQKV